MDVRGFRHDSDLMGWCCDQVPKVPHMGHLQAVVKLQASPKSGVRTARGGRLVSPALHGVAQLPGHPVGCLKSGQLELKGQPPLMIWNRC